MTHTPATCDVLIVGAGLSGLAAATALAGTSLRVLVLDKGRSPGGRLATRRIGPGRADHGAQFFTARSPAFTSLVDRWLSEGIVFHWSDGWSDGSLAPAGEGHPRYAVDGGMQLLARHLAHAVASTGTPVATNTRVTSLAVSDGLWLAHDDDGRSYHSRACILTAPVPQSLAILDAGQTTLAPDQRTALEAIRYAPCLCALAWVDGTLRLPAPGALHRPGHDFPWIADNRAKGISPEATLVTLHASPAWSYAHYADEDAQVLAHLVDELHQSMDAGAVLRHVELKRWRYALATALYPAPCLLAAGLPPLIFAGDAFGAPRVEGALLSGQAAAEAVMGALAVEKG